MKPIEDELRRALRRIDPPTGFTNRVMVRARDRSAVKSGFNWLRPFRMRFGSGDRWSGAWLGWKPALGFAMAVAVLLVVASAVVWHRRQVREEQRQGELARAQVMQALRITSVKLHRVRTRVQKATEDGGRLPDRGKASRTGAFWEGGRLANNRNDGSKIQRLI